MLVAAGLPTNVAGWGPREGVAAWAFGAAGLGADQGVATAVVYGVIVAVPACPGPWCSLVGARGSHRPCGRRRRVERWPMAERPYTILSCGISLDGYLDAGTAERLVLSNDGGPATGSTRCAPTSDAILVGAATVRHDNPRLLVRTPALRDERRRRGAAGVADEGDRDRERRASTGATASSRPGTARSSCTPRARRPAASAGWPGSPPWSTPATPVDLADVVEDLARRGVRRLMVEGGGRIHTQFLTADLADELHLVVAPFFVGDARARRFVGTGAFPWNPGHRAHLAETRQIGDVVLLRYALSRPIRRRCP